MPLICVAIKAETTEQTIKSVLNAEEADLIEIRLDYRKEAIDLPSIRSRTAIPLIATNRRKDQGGKAEESEEERLKILYDAVEAGFKYIDIASTTENLVSTVTTMQNKGAKVIVSYHDFVNQLSLEQIEAKHKEIAETGCDLVKIIGWARSYKDNLPYLEYNKMHPGNISFSMGELGTISRILAPLSGALFTYASLETGKESAAGQIPLKQLREIYGSIQR